MKLFKSKEQAGASVAVGAAAASITAVLTRSSQRLSGNSRAGVATGVGVGFAALAAWVYDRFVARGKPAEAVTQSAASAAAERPATDIGASEDDGSSTLPAQGARSML